jgi:hypothetical protein
MLSHLLPYLLTADFDLCPRATVISGGTDQTTAHFLPSMKSICRTHQITDTSTCQGSVRNAETIHPAIVVKLQPSAELVVGIVQPSAQCAIQASQPWVRLADREVCRNDVSILILNKKGQFWNMAYLQVGECL